jgi:plasmid stabilization system protein ParE
MRIKFLDQAKLDLIEQNDYFRELGGAALANKMMARIKSQILVIKNNPEIAPQYELAPGIRRLVVAGGAFLVFYRVGTYIEIIHIRRSERMPASGHELKPR